MPHYTNSACLGLPASVGNSNWRIERHSLHNPNLPGVQCQSNGRCERGVEGKAYRRSVEEEN
jgi:hypothetical protein